MEPEKEIPAANGAKQRTVSAENYTLDNTLEQPDFSTESNLTVLQNELYQTDKTEETYIQSNRDFLMGIFGNISDDKKPVLVCLSGNPQTAPKKEWSGREWNPGAPDLPHTHNNYFSLSTYYPNDKGEYRRKKDQFYACHAFMLDDIGTKIPMERLTLPPSWLIETSQGNHQAGYILDKPLTDPKLADRTHKSPLRPFLFAQITF
jgi:hypothetical protein